MIILHTMRYGETLFARNEESLEGASGDDILSMIQPKTQQAISFEGIKERLDAGEQLQVKFGTDPTGPDLHLGHIVPIRILDILSRAGHHVDLIFGDFTAKVGDPTGRNKERPMLTDEDIARNMSTFQSQVNHYFDTTAENVRVHRNSAWLGQMALSEAFSYLQAINLTEATQREDFRNRMQNGQAVSLAEAMYGTLMGMDSVHLDTDLEIGGIDQLLNFQQTRAVQKARGQRPEEIVMTPIIEGTTGDGRKMSKSYGNYIPVRIENDDLFGKFMSIPDSLIVPYITAFAPVRKEDIHAIELAVKQNPMEMKKQLATYMVATSSGSYDMGLEMRQGFEDRFANKKLDIDSLPVVTHSQTVIDTLLATGDYKSRSEIRRLAQQGGIKINGVTVSEEEALSSEYKIAGDDVLTVGKLKAYKISGA